MADTTKTLREAADAALAVLATASSFLSKKARDRAPKVIADLRAALAAQAQAEPTWSADECARVLATLRYVQGIAERGEGRSMRDDETLEQFVLGYVQRLEGAPQPVRQPLTERAHGIGQEGAQQ